MRKTVVHGENGIRWKFTSQLDDLDFADGVVLISSTTQENQDKTTRMDEETRRVGLKINVKKTKAIRINKRNQEMITIDGHGIGEVDDFTYLRATICKDGGSVKDLQNRLSKARGAFAR